MSDQNEVIGREIPDPGMSIGIPEPDLAIGPTDSHTEMPEMNLVIGQSNSDRPAIPEEICHKSDQPIYACYHCRDNGTFDPSKYSFKTEAVIRLGQSRVEWAMDREPLPPTPGSDEWFRQKLEQIKLENHRRTDPVTEAFQRGHFGKNNTHGQPSLSIRYTRNELKPDDNGC